MGSLRDQLQQLLKKTVSKGRNALTGSSSRSSNSELPASPEGWKAGVRPLEKRQDRIAQPSGTSQGKKQSSNAPPNTGTRKTPKPVAGSAAAKPPVRHTVAPQTTPPRPPQAAKPLEKLKLPEARIQEPPKNKLSKIGDFRFPADWVEAGRFLQPPGSADGRILSVRLGIDFGTAYTKVAVRLADSVFAIDFRGITSRDESAFLLPGEISLDSTHSAWIGHHPQTEDLVSGLKLPFLSTSYTSLDGKINATLFLAWIMRYSRAWIFQHLSGVVADRSLAWEINVGIPSNSWADDGLNRRYDSVITSAWELSQDHQNITRERAREILLAKRQPIDTIGLDDLRLVPEFIAQMAGYVLSPQRPEKGNELHLLVDVGAGTVDIACFGAYRPHNDLFYRFPTWASSVDAFGTHFLMEARHAVLGRRTETWDDFAGVPDFKMFAQMNECSEKEVQRVDQAFSDKVSIAIGKVLSRTKTLKHPMAREWKSGIRTFLVGGGSHCAVFRDATSTALKRIRTPLKPMDFPLQDLENISEIEPQLSHRLSVAYGLTFDADSIGEAILPEQISDIGTKSSVAVRPDRDELYPK